MKHDERPGVWRVMPALGAGRDKGTSRVGIEAHRQQDSYTMTNPLKAPFPWPGGKSDIAPAVWRRFGNVSNFCEPFAGSSAMLLGRPGGASGTETCNDLDGFIVNAYRAIQFDPEQTAALCDWPVSEACLTSTHLWLKAQRPDLTERLFGDPFYFDPLVAARWLWGVASWIGDGWCVADGPWVSVDGRLVDRRKTGNRQDGVSKRMPEVGLGPNSEYGFNRKGIQAHRSGVPRKMPWVSANDGGSSGKAGVNRETYYGPGALQEYFAALSERLRRVRFLCGDWRRAVKPSITVNHGLTAVYLDPPYPSAEHDMAYHGGGDVWYDVARWAVEAGDDPRLRIALSGYYSEEADRIFPATWARERWEARGGYSNQSKNGRGRKNAKRECVWYSPHCIDPANEWSGTLFEEQP